MRSSRAAILGVTLLAVFGAAAPAGAATTIGSNLGAAPDGSSFMCGTGCTFGLTALPASSQAAGGVVAPTDGVVVRWRIRTGSDVSSTSLRVIGPGSGPTNQTGGAAGPSVTPATDDISSFDVRLPIKAGDGIGIDCCTAFSGYLAAVPDAEFRLWVPALGIGAVEDWLGGLTNNELLINADIEPDVDADGFGDETQDGCPSDASVQGACPKATTKAIRCRGKVATIVGTPGPDTLRGTRSRDVIQGMAGADVIKGGGGGDVICGSGGPDRLFGNKGRDTLIGGPGSDLLRGGAGLDTLFGGSPSSGAAVRRGVRDRCPKAGPDRRRGCRAR